MSGFRSTRYVRFKLDGPPPSWLWESGNPALFAGFPSAVETLFLGFHGAAFPQSFPGDSVCPRTATATLARCIGLRHAAVPNTPQLIQMFAYSDRTSRQGPPPARRLDLENFSSHHDRIIPVHHSLLLQREHHVQILSPAGQKCAARLQRRNLKPLIELRHVVLPQKLVRLLQRDNSMQPQLLRQPSLPGSKPAFRSPSCLRRIRRDHPYV